MAVDKSKASDPYDFLVPAPASKTSLSVAGRVDAALKRQMAQVLASHRFPYKNESDLVRAAVFWFMARVVAPHLDKPVQDEVRLSVELVHQAQQIARLNNATDFCQRTRQAIEVLMWEGAHDEATAAYRRAETFATTTREPFRSRVLNYLHTNIQLEAVRRRLPQDPSEP